MPVAKPSSPKSPHKPNEIPLATRIINAVYSIFLIAVGTVFLTTGRMLLPGKRISGPNGIDMDGIAAWLMFAAIVCACINLVSQIVDHYDRRDNESTYAKLSLWLRIIGWSLFIVALIVYALS